MPGDYARGNRTINPQATHTAVCLSSSEDRSDCGLARVAQNAPEPIDTRKKKESRATIDRTLSVMQCPTLLAFSRKGSWLEAAVDPP
jgi:hypothetical protein